MSRNIYARRQLGSPSEIRATPNNPSFNLFDPAAWDHLTDGESSASGVPINHDRAMKAASVWQACSMISGDVSKLHLDLYKEDAEGYGSVDKSHPAYNLVRWDWNDEVPAFFGWRTIMLHALLWGNGYAYIDRNGRGDPIGLFTLLPDRCHPERKNGKLIYVTETTHPDGAPWLRAMEPREVLHIRGMSADGMSGADLTGYAKDCISVALATEQFQARYFRNGIRNGGLLMLPREMSDKAKSKVSEGFAKEYSGPDNWFKTVILRDGAKFESAQASLRDSQMVELDEEYVRKVCRFFCLSPSRLGLSDSVSYNSKSEDNQGYLDTTLSHWLTSITAECRKKLLSQANRDNLTHYFKHDTSVLLRMNALQRYQVYAIAKQNRIQTTNEIRKQEDMKPIDGGDILDAPTTSAGGPDKGGDMPPRGDADKTGGKVKEKKSDVPNVEYRRLVFGIAAQARHKAGKPKAFLEWIDGGLQSHRTADNSSVVDEFVKMLKAVAETSTEAELFKAVDSLMTSKEMAT